MAKAKEQPKDAEVSVETVSPSKAEMLRIIEAYKKQNPAKAELKKDEFARKLAALK